MTFAALGDSAVVMALGDPMSGAALTRVRRLAEVLESAALPGIIDVVPAYSTVAVFYDPGQFLGGAGNIYDNVCQALAACASAAGIEGASLPGSSSDRQIELPVCYGGGHGPDLGAVAGHGRLTETEVVARHSEAEYRVQAIGFAPGFPYLAGLPESLRTPRRTTPRPSVPPGSVGIGGAQTGVYPLETPGGWQLIGRTPTPLFRPRESPPALLRVGDRVRFRPIESGEFDRLAEDQRADAASRERPDDEASCNEIRDKAPGIEVARPGLLTTVQDLGRTGFRSAGLPLGGAMDRFALRVANLLVGNAEDAAGLEITLLGPELVFSSDSVVAVCGAEFEGVPSWRPIRLQAGERLKFGECRRGCRAYLSVSGGIEVPRVLGGRGTYLRARIGGFQGRALREGDRLRVGQGRGEPSHAGSWRVSSGMLPAYSDQVTLRAVRGAQAGDFGGELWGAGFRVSPNSDRMGLRLSGASLSRSGAEDLVSTAVAPGTVQVPPDGNPILLMADAQTIGGYPQAAHLISADIPLAAQLRPGDRLRFSEVTLAEAHDIGRTREREFAHLRMGLQA